MFQDARRYLPTNLAAANLDSARAFARRIRDAGGRTVDYFPEGMPHGFYFFPGVHPEEDVAYRVVAEALADVFAR